MSPEKPVWEPPGHLLPYGRHTHYPDRAAELFNSDATPFNNTPLFIMHVETQAQWALLERLHAAGQLRPAPPAPVSWKRTWAVLGSMIAGLVAFAFTAAALNRHEDGWIAVAAIGLLTTLCSLGLLYTRIRTRGGTPAASSPRTTPARSHGEQNR